MEEERSVHLTRAEGVKEAMDILERETFDMLFLDYFLKDGTGFDLLVDINQKGLDIPAVVITGQGDEILATKIIQAGAYDYIPKSKLMETSLARIIHNTMQKARLKKVNDTYGHLCGDMVLTEIGKMLKNHKRLNDLVCRYGGEEFAVILPNTKLEGSANYCEKIRQKVAQHPFKYDTIKFHITISLGFASSFRAVSLGELLEHADQALYQAKELGRNRVEANNK